ncbi:unnamed protein product [Didymodactylos carnosus]|uniref:Coronin n=1 Tax=Didymodactylos carnosus TaxID=1234261 RepID=A0A813UX37_9BILA|nr:unnamed protein product [Didymodactylos carnosus]CAF3623570.1 unnamed protein product [Didymodactylos carnosus]
MARVVRNSKFRHVFGQAAKKQDCYENIRITKSAWDSTFCTVNPKFLAVITESAGGGAFMVLPLDKVGRLDRDVPLVTGHKAAVLDIQWCPHNDNVIASGSEDCTVKVWQIPDHGLTQNLTQASVDLIAHQRRVGQVLWHPTALNILLSSGGDTKILIWNVGKSTILTTIDCHPEVILSISWNYDGSRIITACKDKYLRVINPRNGEVLKTGLGHQGAKPMRAIYLRDGRIFTTGFSKMSERQYALWDEATLGNALVMEELDSSNGVLFPFYDEDTGLIFLCGKGDSTIRYFEYTPEPPYIHFINMYSSSDPQRGIGVMPKRGMNTTICEIARFYKLLNTGLCEVISFTVPRKSELFQEDLYPDTVGEEHAITADEWIKGTNAKPVLMSIRDLQGGGKTPGQSGNSGGGSAKQEVVFGKSTSTAAKTQQNLSGKSSSTQSQKDGAGNQQQSSSQNKIEPIQELQQQSNHLGLTQQSSLSSPTSVSPSSNNTINQQILSKLNDIFFRMNDFDKRLQFIERALRSGTTASTLLATKQLSVSKHQSRVENDSNDDLRF